MNRRDFLKTSAASTGVLLPLPVFAEDPHVVAQRHIVRSLNQALRSAFDEKRWIVVTPGTDSMTKLLTSVDSTFNQLIKPHAYFAFINDIEAGHQWINFPTNVFDFEVLYSLHELEPCRQFKVNIVAHGEVNERLGYRSEIVIT